MSQVFTLALLFSVCCFGDKVDSAMLQAVIIASNFFVNTTHCSIECSHVHALGSSMVETSPCRLLLAGVVSAKYIAQTGFPFLWPAYSSGLRREALGERVRDATSAVSPGKLNTDGLVCPLSHLKDREIVRTQCAQHTHV